MRVEGGGSVRVAGGGSVRVAGGGKRNGQVEREWGKESRGTEIELGERKE